MLGEMLNDWARDFEADEDLRFQFRTLNAYRSARLHEAYRSVPEYSRKFATFGEFSSAAKQEASRILVAERDAASRNAARRQANDARGKDKGPVAEFVGRLLER